MRLGAVFPPMPTPFTGDGDLDLSAIRANVTRWMTTGLGGIVALGTNGEAALLDDDEAVRVVETARAHVPRDRVLIAGVGRESTRATVAAARQAAAAGADAVLVRAPSFYRAQVPLPALAQHYTVVADASPVPVLLYNYPAFTGVNLTPDLVGRLAEHPNVLGMKETSTDGGQFSDLSARVPPRFTILAGSAPGFFTALCAGARGAILAIACVLPGLCIELLETVEAGRHPEALEMQQRLNPIARAVTSGYGIAGLKAAMELAGYRGGPPRAPLGRLPAGALTELQAHMKTAIGRQPSALTTDD